MSADKRSVATDALETLGMVISENEKRDAIHLAVEPVVAGMKLRPGEDVGFFSDGTVGKVSNPLGIVDPFLKTPVQAGQRFWLVVYPRQITSLRHVWEHPDFPLSGETETKREEDNVKEKAAAERWIRDYADNIGVDYNKLLRYAENWVEDQRDGSWGNYLVQGSDLEGICTSDEFWNQFQILKGEDIHEDHRGNFFSCSC